MRRLRLTNSTTSPPYFMFFRMVQRGSTVAPLRPIFLRRLIWVAIFVAISNIARAIARLSSTLISLKSLRFISSWAL